MFIRANPGGCGDDDDDDDTQVGRAVKLSLSPPLSLSLSAGIRFSRLLYHNGAAKQGVRRQSRRKKYWREDSRTYLCDESW